MSSSPEPHKTPVSAPVFVAIGLLVGVMAWLLPVSLKSVSKGLLRSAGAGTPSVAEFGRDLVDSEKIGPATFLLTVAKAVDDPQAPALEKSLAGLAERQPALVAWGGWDPSLDPLFNLHQHAPYGPSTPVLTFLIPEVARNTVRGYLSNSESLGVKAVLKNRGVTTTGRFVPASRPGGQPLDALILLTGLLYQGEHLSATLQREIRGLAESANTRNDLGDLEGFYLDLLSLGRRLDWTQLGELLKRTASVRTVGEYAHLEPRRPRPAAVHLFGRPAGQLLRPGGVLPDSLRQGRRGGPAPGPGGRPGRRSTCSCSGRSRSTARPARRWARRPPLVLVHPRLHARGQIRRLHRVGLFLILRGLRPLDHLLPPGVSLRRAATARVGPGCWRSSSSALLVVATEPFLLKRRTRPRNTGCGSSSR